MATRNVPKSPDLAGRVFGKLTVIGRAPSIVCVSGRKYGCSHCRCECGRETITRNQVLLNGNAKSCGCLKSTFIRDAARRHGCSSGPTWNSWAAMLSRCTYEKHPAYHRYGGRGILVCDRWKRFENFIDDMGPRPDGMQLDRIDNSGNYEPGNCRWVTPSQNIRNKSDVAQLTAFGETKSLPDWAEDPRCPVCADTLYQRYLRKIRRGTYPSLEAMISAPKEVHKIARRYAK